MVGIGIGVTVKFAAGGFFTGTTEGMAVGILFAAIIFAAIFGYVFAFATMLKSFILTAFCHGAFAMKWVSVGLNASAAVEAFSKGAL